MLSSFTSSLRPSFSLATRALSTSTTVRQQPKYSEVSICLPFSYFIYPAAVNSISKPTFQTTFPQDGSEQVFRPSNVQSKRMDDVGTRSIFTPEQVKRNVSRTERNEPPPLCRICSGSLSGSSCRIPLHLNRSNTASQHSKKHAHLWPSRDLQKNHSSKRWLQTK